MSYSSYPCTIFIYSRMRQNKITESVLESCQTGTNFLTLPVAANPGGEYAALVVTSNPLGKNTSQLYNFTFYDIGRWVTTDGILTCGCLDFTFLSGGSGVHLATI